MQKIYKVGIIPRNSSSLVIEIEAINATQAREFAKARYPEAKIGSVKL